MNLLLALQNIIWENPDSIETNQSLPGNKYLNLGHPHLFLNSSCFHFLRTKKVKKVILPGVARGAELWSPMNISTPPR